MAFKAVHDYGEDKVTVQGTGGLTVLQNQIHIMKGQHKRMTPQAPALVCAVTENCDQDDEPVADINMDAFQGDDANLFT